MSAQRQRTVFLWIYVAAVLCASVLLTVGPVAKVDIHPSSFSVPWYFLAIAVYLAETAVIHLQVRRDTHSFSMSEVPLILGVAFSAPLPLVGAIAIGNIAALAINRHQTPIKLVFNVGISVIQAGVGMMMLDGFEFAAGRVGPAVIQVFSAVVVANAVGHLLIVGVIRLSGGQESLAESLTTLGLSSTGSTMNALMGLFAASMIEADTASGWLALAPPAFLYLAYRGYVSQKTDKERMTKLFEATQALHRTPQVEQALEAASRIALELVNAEQVHVLVYGAVQHDIHYLTSVNRDGALMVMSPIILDLAAPPYAGLFGHSGPIRFDAASRDLAPIGWRRDSLVVPLVTDHGRIGTMVAADRIGDVSSFDARDLQLLSTFAAQLAVSLANGRLTDTLSEVRALQTRLEALLKSKDQLIASVSHELRTPLTGIIGLTQVLREGTADQLDSESSEMLDMIVDQGNDLSDIIDDLLAYARTEDGSLTVDLTPIAVGDTIRSAAVGVAGDTIEIDSKPIDIEAVADPLRVRQIIRNLVSNAHRYGGPKIWVEVAASGAEVLISVCDDGSGVPSASAESIFEPYRSAHDQRLQPGSVGLGLALSRKLARLMDGDLVYERRSDNTTAFKLTLTRANVPA